MRSASGHYSALLVLMAATVALTNTHAQDTSPQKAKQSVKITAQKLGPLTAHVFKPDVTPGAKKVQVLQDEHRRGALTAKRHTFSETSTSTQMDPSLRSPALFSVNDQSVSSTWIVPGAPYVLKGRGFGTTPGEVKLLGGFPGNPPKFRVDLWQNNAIHVYLEDNISGAYDQENVTLSITAPGVVVTHDAVKFFAAREVRAFDVSPYFRPANVSNISKNFRGNRTTSKHNGLFRVEGMIEWEVNQRDVRPPYIECEMGDKKFKRGNIDQFVFQNFKPGWAVVGYEWYIGRQDSGDADYQGNPGSRVTIAGPGPGDGYVYHLEFKPMQFDVKWAVFNSVTKKPCLQENPAFAYTLYEIKGYAEGPRGTAIF